ncbi:MAG TPA: aldo/keto reductase, partial [Lacipirellulaceae bacterium]|nr:aldo/keto reductase [Lacipirellulaceae bacterium]
LKEMAPRETFVLATKVHQRMRPDVNGAGLSRKAILTEIDNSLRRLGTDYVDLYQIHRWDRDTPIEETLEALNDVVRAGKARYIGASSMYAWQFAKALYLSKQNGWARFISMQNHYNLMYREEEREMMPLCHSEGVGVIPWSPLARGRLARPWKTEGTARSAGTSDAFGSTLYASTEDADHKTVDALQALAAQRGVPMAQIALAWHLSKPFVTAPIIGATKPEHLNDAVAATEIKLSPDEITRLEAPYIPHPVLGFK